MMLAGANDQQQGSANTPAKKEEPAIVKVGEVSLWTLGVFFVALPLLLLYLSNVDKERNRKRYA
jgi:hypothetical protein